jgi:hypothetical protein
MDASYVIKKFLNAQRIHNLTTYLQALHEKKQVLISCNSFREFFLLSGTLCGSSVPDWRKANPDHTTLLISCYTKQKDLAKLSQFIQVLSFFISLQLFLPFSSLSLFLYVWMFSAVADARRRRTGRSPRRRRSSSAGSPVTLSRPS